MSGHTYIHTYTHTYTYTHVHDNYNNPRCACAPRVNYIVIYPASHDIPQHRVGGICLDSISTSMGDGHLVTFIQDGRPIGRWITVTTIFKLHSILIGVNCPDLGGTVPLLGYSSRCPTLH